MSGSGAMRGISGGTGATSPETILQEMPTAIIVAEAPSGRVVLCNEHVAAIWRRPLTLASGLEEYGAWNGFHPDGRRYLPEEWPLARSLRGEAVEGEEVEIERGDGTRGVIRVCSTPLRDAEGNVTSAVATFHDVTLQRQRETARRLLSEASAVLGSSLDYRVTLRNVARLAVPSFADWCGVDIVREGGRIERLASEHVDRRKAAVAREMSRRFPPDRDAPRGVPMVLRTGRAELHTEINDAALSAAACDEEHLKILRELGLRSAIIVPLIARGKTLGALTFALDQPSRRYGPEDLELARDLAVRAALAIDNARLYEESQTASRAKSDFLAVMSHELRTPLTAIIGYAELLELGIPEAITERQREQVERIEVAARHLQMLIEEVLTVASLESSGEAKLRRQEVRLSELLHRAEIIIRPMAMAKELDLRVDPAETDAILETDPEKLLQVLLNLLANAVKFTDAGEIRLTARVVDGFAEVTVSDTGIGVAAADQERIFDPFWQVEQPITRRAGGTGLGLTISRRLMDLLGGEIRVQSEPGKGSAFMARVPLRSPA